MGVRFLSYCATGELDTNSIQGKQIKLLSGEIGGTIVKSLQLITGNESCYAWIIRKDANDNEYATIKVDLKANDYLLLWQGFFVIPSGYKLYFKSDSTSCKLIANVVQMTS